MATLIVADEKRKIKEEILMTHKEKKNTDAIFVFRS